jgi:membrane dipeptidase
VPPWTLGRTDGPCGALRKREGVAAFFSFEGVTPLGFELTSVERWVARGVRLFGLVHSYDTAVASSSGYSFHASDYGLSRRGKDLVRRIAAWGGIVDVSHASDAATADILELAKARGSVVVATHSNARAIANHARNLTDAQIRAIAETGGVVGVAFHAPFLTGGSVARLDDVVAHILHIRKVGGIRAVALGSDFEGGIRPPKQLEDVRGFPVLAQALRRAGLTDAEVRQVFGQNAERVLCAATLGR